MSEHLEERMLDLHFLFTQSNQHGVWIMFFKEIAGIILCRCCIFECDIAGFAGSCPAPLLFWLC